MIGYEEQHEINSLKEQLQGLLRDNQILKRAVTIQHERNSDHDEKVKEVQHLKNVIGQYQEQVRGLEVIRSYSRCLLVFLFKPNGYRVDLILSFTYKLVFHKN